jgi:uncharacterized protein (TIGR03083 family)
MTDTPPFAELLILIDERSAALRDAVAATGDLGARVPGCPEWTLRDLVAHLGGVQRFWALVVRQADPAAPPTAEQFPDAQPPADLSQGDLLDWFADSTVSLLGALRKAGPDSPAWTWWAKSEAPMTAGAVARHQVQEAAVHAWDAQDTIGKREPLPAAVAVDGVAEFLRVGLGAQGAWPHRPARVAFTATEGPSWVLDLSPSGARLDPPASGAPLATVHASASDLVLSLYGRLPFEDIRVDGDRAVLKELRDWGNTE